MSLNSTLLLQIIDWLAFNANFSSIYATFRCVLAWTNSTNCRMSAEHQRHFRFQLKHVSVNNLKYTEYIPVVCRPFTTTICKPIMTNTTSDQYYMLKYSQTCFSDHLYYTMTCIFWPYFNFPSQCILYQLNLY